tara:strand:- start:463 stop:879 length:417 start_codon:yes stop_codon:yes gene_type:complete
MQIVNNPIIITTPYNLMELFMKYFSIDYRSPPSGMGQIINTELPSVITEIDGSQAYNYTLIQYGLNCRWDTSYVYNEMFETPTQDLTLEVFNQIIQYLKDQNVTHVYDGELSYEEDGADDDGYFTLQRWSDIIRGYLK